MEPTADDLSRLRNSTRRTVDAFINFERAMAAFRDSIKRPGIYSPKGLNAAASDAMSDACNTEARRVALETINERLAKL